MWRSASTQNGGVLSLVALFLACAVVLACVREQQLVVAGCRPAGYSVSTLGPRGADLDAPAEHSLDPLR